ncbi:MAG: hypothetical protein HGA95_03825 [Caldiserica bacterium]|nr:hypothetical protein [Caldisericota bacterium]
MAKSTSQPVATSKPAKVAPKSKTEVVKEKEEVLVMINEIETKGYPIFIYILEENFIIISRATLPPMFI